MANTERPSRSWTDDDPEFANRVRTIAQRMAQGIEPTDGTDTLDVIAAWLWLGWTFPNE